MSFSKTLTLKSPGDLKNETLALKPQLLDDDESLRQISSFRTGNQNHKKTNDPIPIYNEVT